MSLFALWIRYGDFYIWYCDFWVVVLVPIASVDLDLGSPFSQTSIYVFRVFQEHFGGEGCIYQLLMSSFCRLEAKFGSYFIRNSYMYI